MNETTLEQRVQRLEDIEAIKQLKARYARACDHGYDTEALASLFTEDAVWDGGFIGRAEGREAIREFFRGSARRISFAIHNILSPVIEVGGDTATGTWYLLQACTYTRDNQAAWGAATYHDRYVRERDGWKFREVRIESHFWTPYESGWAKTPFLRRE